MLAKRGPSPFNDCRVQPTTRRLISSITSAGDDHPSSVLLCVMSVTQTRSGASTSNVDPMVCRRQRKLTAPFEPGGARSLPELRCPRRLLVTRHGPRRSFPIAPGPPPGTPASPGEPPRLGGYSWYRRMQLASICALGVVSQQFSLLQPGYMILAVERKGLTKSAQVKKK